MFKKVMRMTQNGRVVYPFVLGGVTVYIFLFALHGGSNVNYYKRIAQDLNPLIEMPTKAERSPQYYEILKDPNDREKASDGKRLGNKDNWQSNFHKPEEPPRKESMRGVNVVDTNRASDIIPSADELHRSLDERKNQESLVEKQSSPVEKQSTSVKKYSPVEKQGSPVEKQGSPVEKYSPVEKQGSPVENQGSPVEKYSPVEKQGSPVEKQGSPVEKQGSPVEKQGSPVEKQGSPVEKQSNQGSLKAPSAYSSTKTSVDKVLHTAVTSSTKKTATIKESNPIDKDKFQPGAIDKPRGIQLPTDVWRNDEFEKLNGLDLYVRNAYYDKRNDNEKKLIRVWTINPLNMLHDVFCHVMWIKRIGEVKVNVIKGFMRIQDSSVRPFCKYFTGVIECEWNESYVPKHVMISPSKYAQPNRWHNIRHINLPEKPPMKIGICLKTLFDHGDQEVGPLMEWFELNRLLGVDKVIMYGYDNVTAKVKKLLHHYKDTGFLNMKSWKLPMQTFTKNIYKMKFTDPKMKELVKKTTTNQSDIPCVRYHAQHLTYMDCIYDNMHKFNYLIFIDVDEYIIPERNKTLKDLLWHLDTLKRYKRTASFVFEEACFSHQPKAVLKNNTGMTLLSQNYTRGPIKSDHKAMKSVIRPRYVKNMHIHSVAGKHPSIWGYKNLDYVNSNLGKMHHYKNSGRCEPYNYTDKATSKFQAKLIPVMSDLWNNLYGIR